MHFNASFEQLKVTARLKCIKYQETYIWSIWCFKKINALMNVLLEIHILIYLETQSVIFIMEIKKVVDIK